MALKSLYQLALITYTVGSPFFFLWFHRNVMKQTWDGDLADAVTLRLYVISNIAAQAAAYMLLECGRCG
jgi:hypothetical protein